MNKALFLDRDGVINVEKHYLYKIEDVEFVEGIFSLVQRFKAAGYLVIMVTNQSGIARGMYSQEDFAQLSEWMKEQFKAKNAALDAIYYCPHHPYIDGSCSCRKPKPGMLLEAKERFDIDMAHSVMVGDKERDIEAAINAQVGRSYLFVPKCHPTKASACVTSLDEIRVNNG